MEMDDDSDDSSSLETLDQFREKWQKELVKTTTKNDKTSKNASKAVAKQETTEDLVSHTHNIIKNRY